MHAAEILVWRSPINISKNKIEQYKAALYKNRLIFDVEERLEESTSGPRDFSILTGSVSRTKTGWKSFAER